MDRPWAQYGFGEWAWAQLRSISRPRPVYQIPDVDLPGCEGGAVSRRRWLNWRQANSVSAFSVIFLREMLTELAKYDVHPTESWLVQTTNFRPFGGHKRILDSTGTANGAYLVTATAINEYVNLTRAIDAVTSAHNYPVPDLQPTGLGDLNGPYGFGVGISGRPPHARNNPHFPVGNHYLTLTSPTYYCRYYTPEDWPGTAGDRRWPIDPAAERAPLVEDSDPQRSLPCRAQIPAATEQALAVVVDWGEFLGFHIGPPTARRWEREKETYMELDKYVLTAPVTLTAGIDEIKERARPYSQIEVNSTPRGDRSRHWTGEPNPLIRVAPGHFGVSANIDDTDNGAPYQLTLESRAIPTGKNT